MSFRLLCFRFCVILAVLALNNPLAGRLAAQSMPRGRPIEFSDPKGGGVYTNLQEFGSRTDRLKQLEEELSQPLRMFSPDTSLGGAPVPFVRPSTTPVIQSKKLQDLLERRKNWAFLSPEDVAAGPTAEDIFGVPKYEADGQETSKTPALEQYFKNIDRRQGRSAGLTKLSEEDLFGQRKTTDSDSGFASSSDSDMPSGVKDSEQALKQLLVPETDINTFAPFVTRGSPADIFGLGDQTLSPKQISAHKAYMQEFQNVLNGTTAAPGIDPLDSLNPFNPLQAMSEVAREPVKLGGGLDNLLGTTRHKRLDGQSELIDPALLPNAASDINAQVLNQWNPFSTLPNTDLPKLTPPAPAFTAPRRPF